MVTPNLEARRHFIYWRTLLGALAPPDQRKDTEQVMAAMAEDLGLPPLVMEPRASVELLLRRHPELAEPYAQILPLEDQPPLDEGALRRLTLFSKTLLSVLGDDGGQVVSAEGYNRWLDDVGALERLLGQAPGSLLDPGGGGPASHSPSYGGTDSGGAPEVSDEDLRKTLSEMEAGRGLMSLPEVQNSLQHREKRLIDRMELTEILSDKKLADRIRPSMAIVAQLMRCKGRLSGEALSNAKLIIRRYVDDMRAVLMKEVEKAPSGRRDPSVPPKRVFRNLDVSRTIWKNLPNWDPKSRRLFVDRLIFKHTSKHSMSQRLIVVVDQSGSMVPAMVNCTILASIFATLPTVDTHLLAFDTEVVDLTEWVKDPFEVLLRTDLGGGNDGCVAMELARTKIVQPRKTVMVWISDFYERRELFPMIEQVARAGVTFIGVGSISGSGFFSVDPWYRDNFKRAGIPLLSGSLKTLIHELKAALS